jgi:hypothetical protein
VRPGRSYEVRSTVGTAGRIVLSVRSPDGAVLASSEADPRPFPVLAFAVPDAPPPAPSPASPSPSPPPRAPRPPSPVLVVRGVGGAGGTYGVRLVETPRREPDGEPAAAPPAPVQTGPIPDVPLGFRANPGDVAMLFLPSAHRHDPHVLEAREGDAWVPVPREGVSIHGERAAAHMASGTDALVVFRAHRAGEYRFVTAVPSAEPVLRVHPAERAGGAPILLGTNLDPTVLARARPGYRTIGLGVAVAGRDYLFVAAGGGVRDLALRVVGMDGKVIAQRGTGMLASQVPGVGPSMRFRLREPAVVRLEVSGSAWRGYAMLRQASN